MGTRGGPCAVWGEERRKEGWTLRSVGLVWRREIFLSGKVCWRAAQKGGLMEGGAGWGGREASVE